MKAALLIAALLIAACAAEQVYDPLVDYEEVDATTMMGAPESRAGSYAPADRFQVERGKYLVELLGCGACHTDGALVGEPNMAMAMAGSRVGIAYTSPLEHEHPGVVYPANITPDVQTGIGGWTKDEIANAIRAGIGRHGSRRIATMPWQGYAILSDDDTDAIVSYLLSIPAVNHEVPAEVRPGRRAREEFVYFGVYQSR